MAHPIPARPVLLETDWLTVLSDFVLLEQANRGAVERTANVTSARSHIASFSDEELAAIREALGAELVSRTEDWAREHPLPGR